MSKFKIGMYVRCPFEFDTKFPRDYLVGQIIKIDDEFDKITVKFYADKNLAEFCGVPEQLTYDAKYITRCNLTLHQTVIIKNGLSGEIYSLITPKDKNEYMSYCLLVNNENKIVNENIITANIDQGNYNPINQMLRYEINNPAWYKARCVVSQSMQNIENAPFGFETLLGSRTYLFNHQVDTIIRALTTKDCKYMLADEVGLGKTIEACTIIKGLMMKYGNIKTLLIVPDSLIYQWQNELYSKFWIEAPIIGKDKVVVGSNIFLISQEFLDKFGLPYSLNFDKIDVLLVDETHRLLFNDNLYKRVLDLSKKSHHILLLSATPITKMTNEYHKLLILLNPERYQTMSSGDFEILLNKQNEIRNIVYDLMQDLPDYIDYDLYDDFVDYLSRISDMINDNKFKEIVEKINHSAEDKGCSQVKLALAYLSEFYQIDQSIIRHRRKEIQEETNKRIGKLFSYQMKASDEGKHEYELYENVISFLEYCAGHKQKEFFETKALNLLTATFSSPEAVLSVIKDLNNGLSLEELNMLSSIETLTKLCSNEVNDNELRDREQNLIDYLETSKNNKVLIFTGYAETAERLELAINKFYNSKVAVSFNKNKSREKSQEAVDIFQNDETCKFMICDETGGEGRNFQIADEIIHYDLPLSTFVLEQRIGRLDRIGRKADKDIISVAIVSDNTIELDLFNLFDKGLNIFNESMCGMEIVFQQIQEKIKNALFYDVRNGLSKIVEELQQTMIQMKEEVDRERYFDLAKQFDNNKMEIYNNLIGYFSENDGEIMINTMISWAKMAGFLGIHLDNKYQDDLVFSIDTDTRRSFNIQCAKNSFYFPPRMDDIVKRSKFKDCIYGTFSRDTALKHENLSFFAPGNSLYDGIVTNAIRSYKGRCVALRKSGDINVKAYKMIFNVRFSVKPLIEKNISVSMVNYIKQYITTSQISVYYDISNNSLISDYGIIEEIEKAINAKSSKHLGKRDNHAIDKFVLEHKKEDWSVLLQNVWKLSKEYSKERALLCVKYDYALSQLENKFNSMMARKIYFNEEDLFKDFNLETLEVLKLILKNPITELDSISYVEVVKEEE